MPTKATTVITWTYTPEYFFEDGEKILINDFEINLKKGVAQGAFGSEFYGDKNFRDSMTHFLLHEFRLQQMLTGQIFTLSPGSMTREYPDGRRDAISFAETAVMSIKISHPDIKITDSKGGVIIDTARDRLLYREKFRRINQKNLNDIILRKMLESFGNSLKEPQNKLIHLYEIREVIKVKFGSEEKVCSKLSISKSKWKKFGNITNNQPLSESRHRGKHLITKPATVDQLKFVEEFAKEIIEKYILYLPT